MAAAGVLFILLIIYAFSMAQMIVSHHQDAFFRQENGQPVVTVNVFGHTMDNLEYTYRPAPVSYTHLGYSPS